MDQETLTIPRKELSVFTHDLKNPIAAMQLYLEMLQNGIGGELSEQQKKMVAELVISKDNLTTIINDFRQKYFT